MILHDAETIARYADAGWWGQTTVDDLFRACVETGGGRDPDEPALLDAPNRGDFAFGTPHSLSFRETDEAVDRLAASLVASGVGKDDIVVVQLPNIVEIVIAFLALARIGAIVSPVMLAYGESDLRRIVRHLRPAAVMTLAQFKDGAPADIFRRLLAEGDTPIFELFALGDPPDGGLDLLSTEVGAGELRALAAHLDTTDIDANEIVTMHWTSGTTGVPKCVPRSHNNWHGTGGACVDAGGLKPGDRILAPMQMVHTAGYSGMVMPWLELQGVLALHQPFDMPVFLGQIQDLRINHTVTAPAMMNALLRENILDDFDVSAIRSILCGSAPLDAWMIADFKRRYGIEVVNAFGSSEGMTMLSSPDITDDPQRRARYYPRFQGTRRVSDGRPWNVRIAESCEMRLIDPDSGEHIGKPNTPGEIAFRSTALFPGYWTRDGDVDRSDFDDDGYFRTGEIFEIAGDGEEADFFHYIDRLKDVINRGGVKIPVGELEAAIQALPEVREASAIGFPDERLGERICAVIVPAPGARLDLDGLNAALAESGIARYMQPERLEIVEALPRNVTGKVLKRELAQSLAADSEPAAMPESD
ncbi:class I adenylate-forming enzyme family protein [Elongatibacter sediminis]|uniref:Class I adenylate-forming enzyme family protein n=1 Tax=Elongatibacter sediminis TaxID=3119006 RepID=A0AAW9RD15_9GAMM